MALILFMYLCLPLDHGFCIPSTCHNMWPILDAQILLVEIIVVII